MTKRRKKVLQKRCRKFLERICSSIQKITYKLRVQQLAARVRNELHKFSAHWQWDCRPNGDFIQIRASYGDHTMLRAIPARQLFSCWNFSELIRDHATYMIHELLHLAGPTSLLGRDS